MPTYIVLKFSVKDARSDLGISSTNKIQKVYQTANAMKSLDK